MKKDVPGYAFGSATLVQGLLPFECAEAGFLNLLALLGLPVKRAAFPIFAILEAAANRLLADNSFVELLALNFLVDFVWDALLVLPVAAVLLAGCIVQCSTHELVPLT